MSATILTSVFAHGGRTSRHDQFTVVVMHGCTFITTPMEFLQMQDWARANPSSGNPARDRAAFVNRFETLLARAGSGLSSRGNRLSLSRIVRAMKANALLLEEWSIPGDLAESADGRGPQPERPETAPAGRHATATAANEPLSNRVTPLVRK